MLPFQEGMRWVQTDNRQTFLDFQSWNAGMSRVRLLYESKGPGALWLLLGPAVQDLSKSA
jgi:hypothetical protein